MLLRVLKGEEPPLQARMAALARVKENFCSISRRGMVGLWDGGDGGGGGWRKV